MVVVGFKCQPFFSFNLSIGCKGINLPIWKMLLQILCQRSCYSKNLIRKLVYKVKFFFIVTKFSLRKFMNQPKMFDLLISGSKCTLKNIDCITNNKVYLVIYNNISNIFDILIVRLHSQKMICWQSTRCFFPPPFNG